MTNETLCTLIQEGQKEYLPDLWHQTKRFGAAQAKKFFLSLGNRAVWSLRTCYRAAGLL